MNRNRLVAAGIALVLLPLGAGRATAAEPPPHLGEGQAVGNRVVADPPYRLRAVTSRYYVTSYAQPDDRSPEPWEIQRTTDGTTARTVDRPPGQLDQAPTLLGQYAVQVGAGVVSFRDLGTDATSQVSVPEGAVYEGVYPGGVLLRRGSTMSLRAIGNTEKTVTNAAGDPTILDSDDSSLLLGMSGRIAVVDLATGAGTAVTTLPANPAWAQLTPNRVLWQTAATETTRSLAWKQRTSATTGTIQVPYGEPILPLGDDVAVRIGSELVKVTGAGTVTRPFVTGVHDAADLTTGRLLVSAQSKIASVGSDGVLQTVKATPAFNAQVQYVGLSGSRVVASDQQPAHSLYETSNNGAAWTATGGSSSGKPFQLEGSSLLTFDGTQARVGELTFPAADDVVLGKGGKFVAHNGEIYDVATKAKVLDLQPPFALVGSTAWKVTEPGVLRGQDVTAGTSKTITVASGCTVGPNAANGRWALLTGCAGGNQVVDISGPEAPRNLTVPADAQLGNGFVAQLVDGESSAAGAPASADGATNAAAVGAKDLLVTDLNDPALGQRRYGPVLGQLHPATFRADGSGQPKLVYADPTARPRVITLDWLKPDPQQRADRTPPVLTEASAGDRIRDFTTSRFYWTFRDPADDPHEPASGVLSYDLRIQQRPTPTSPYGAWREIAGWQGIKITEVSLTANPGIDTCWQVRSRDFALNLSAWSASYCSETDGTAPVHVSSRPGDRVILTPAQAYSYQFTDNLDPVAYDVAYRNAAPGQALGAWVYPAAWQTLQDTSVAWGANAGSDRCFQVRARDVIGNVSGWSPQTCSVYPQDDRALTSVGSVTRGSSPLAFLGTTSTLNAKGTALTKTGESGVRIALVTLNGPGQGSVDVFHAGVKIATVSLAATTQTRKVTYLPVTAYRSGEVRIVSTSTAPATVDGIAFLRANP
ncbi:hypothetical protein [Kribbella sp. NPDC051770]|uniref:hypothetical protein n=1 Tax=Kribbella sp. NPDC051770 TaxID=3155413 RepID=UPI00342F8DB9